MGAVWENLVTEVRGLPGVGPKMAERIALHLIRHPHLNNKLRRFLLDAQERLKRCPLCGDFVEADGEPDVCTRCRDPRRDSRLLCVVEESGDLAALERTRCYRGRYHILGGVLSALDGVGPDELRIGFLLERLDRDGADEVILATNPTVEGETTAAYLAEIIQGRGLRVTRLAAGLPSGSVIQYADEHTLTQALDGRRVMNLKTGIEPL